jgi:hypothetical protein
MRGELTTVCGVLSLSQKTLEGFCASLEPALGETEKLLEIHGVILIHRHQCLQLRESRQGGRRLRRHSYFTLKPARHTPKAKGNKIFSRPG